MIIGYVTKVGSHIQETRFDSTESVMESVTEFKEPFSCILQVEGETTFAKLEALVRYYFFLKGSTQAVKDRIRDFEEHFGDACRDITAAQGIEREDPLDISPGTGADTRNSSGFELSWPLSSMAIDDNRIIAPNEHGLYEFETFVEGLRSTSSEANMSSHSPKTPITHPRNKGVCGPGDTPDPGPASRQSNIRFDTDDTSLELDPQDSVKVELKSLRKKVQILDNRLMMAEGRAQRAEQDAAMWRGNYEQLKKERDRNNSA